VVLLFVAGHFSCVWNSGAKKRREIDFYVSLRPHQKLTPKTYNNIQSNPTKVSVE
jgi:hypothetical protein